MNVRLIDRLYAYLSGFPREWMDRGRLAEWEEGHADPDGDVWAVTPPCGDGWQLMRPGSPRVDSPFAYEDVDPASVRGPMMTEDNDASLWLVDVRGWMQPWIESVPGRRVVDMVEGMAWYGEGRRLSEYIIYARVARS